MLAANWAALYNINMKPAESLENVKIASPCSAKWEAMDGDERRRFCAHCRKHVYNVEGMSRADAQKLLAGPEDVCVRIYKRADGTVLTNDCPVGKRHLILRNSLTYAAAAIAAALLIRLLDTLPGSSLHPYIQMIIDRVQAFLPGQQHMMGTVPSNIVNSN